jgi:hypothetical protein
LGSDGWAIELTTFEGGRERGKIEIALGFFALMAGEALLFEDGVDGAVEVDLVRFVVFELGGDGLNAGVEEVVDGVVSGQVGCGSGWDDGLDLGEVVVGGLATF